MSGMAAEGQTKKIFDDRYEILSIVGRGSRSVVYHARHISGSRNEVALKVLLNKKDQSQNSEQLRKEALAMVSARHKYVIRLDDFHSVGNLCYLSMEYAPEADLRQYAQKQNGKLSPRQAELFLLQSGDALHFIHQAGLLHRDIKPDNILVIDKDNVRIGDFGVAILPGEESSLEELQNGVGTMSYMAPEVLDGQGYGKAADIYALAVTFYELLCGKHPFEGVPLIQQLEVRKDGNFAPLQFLIPELPDYLAKPIARAMRYNPEERYQTAREFIQDIVELQKQGAGESQKSPVKEPSAPADPERSAKKPTLEPRKPLERSRSSNDQGTEGEGRQSRSRRRAERQAGRKSEVLSSAESVTAIESKGSESDSISIAEQNTSEQQLLAESSSNESIGKTGEPNTHSAEPVPGDRKQIKFTEDAAQKPGAPEKNFLKTPESAGAPADSKIAEAHSARAGAAAPIANARPAAQSLSKAKRGTQLSPEKRRRLITSIAIAAFLLLFLPGLGQVVNDFLISNFNIDIGSAFKRAPAIESPIPQFSADPNALAFPVLAPGMYEGIVRDFIPDQKTAMSFIVLEEPRQLIVILGIPGWSPAIVSLEGLSQTGEIAIPTNGTVLKFVGRAHDGELIGGITNMVTGQEAEWRARPVLYRQGAKE